MWIIIFLNQDSVFYSMIPKYQNQHIDLVVCLLNGDSTYILTKITRSSIRHLGRLGTLSSAYNLYIETEKINYPLW
jgi:uncharacterized protein (UPF0297 family)